MRFKDFFKQPWTFELKNGYYSSKIKMGGLHKNQDILE